MLSSLIKITKNMAKKMAKNDHPMIEFIVHKVTLSDSTTKNASAMVPREVLGVIWWEAWQAKVKLLQKRAGIDLSFLECGSGSFFLGRKGWNDDNVS